jgi:hypothetical protein
MLFGWQESWAANGQIVTGIVFVTAAQMLCGVAKDLTKLGGKTVTKLVTPDEKEVRSCYKAVHTCQLHVPHSAEHPVESVCRLWHWPRCVVSQKTLRSCGARLLQSLSHLMRKR